MQSCSKSTQTVERRLGPLVTHDDQMVFESTACARLKWRVTDPDSCAVHPEAQLGEGAQGIVFEAIWYGRSEVGEPVAVKEVRREPMSKDEREHLLKLDHHNIVRLKACVSQKRRIYMVLELCDKMNLDGLVHTHILSSILQMDICKQLADGMAYIHSEGIVHRDLKPGNVLMKDRQVVKIADFGIAKERELTAPTTSRATPSFFGTPGFSTERGGGSSAGASECRQSGPIPCRRLFNGDSLPCGDYSVSSVRRLRARPHGECAKRGSNPSAFTKPFLRNCDQADAVNQPDGAAEKCASVP